MAPPGGAQPIADGLTQRLYEDAYKSVVQIYIGESAANYRSGGSGFFVNNDGLIATNAHVALGGPELSVRVRDRFYRARVVGANDVKDIALLQLEGLKPDQVKPLPLGDSSQLRSDDRVFALGHPRLVPTTYISPGHFKARTTLLGAMVETGGQAQADEAVATIKARIPQEMFNDFSKYLTRPMLRGSVHIEGGNSGGPLIDGEGRAVGMAANGDEKATAYFVPIEQVRSVLNNDSESLFRFRYEYKSSGLAKDFSDLWAHQPVEAGVTTGLLAVTGYGGYRGLAAYPRFMGGALGFYGACSLANDTSEYMTSTNSRDSLKYGLSSLADLGIMAGSVASFFPRTRGIGRWSMGLGVGGQIGSGFIPNRLVLADVVRKDGASRPPVLHSDIINRAYR